MARQTPDEVAEELGKLEEENYGQEKPGMSESSEPVDIDDLAKETFGNTRASDEELNIEREIEKDEASIAGLPEDTDL